MHSTKPVSVFLEVSFDHQISLSSHVLILHHLLLTVSWSKGNASQSLHRVIWEEEEERVP